MRRRHSTVVAEIEETCRITPTSRRRKGSHRRGRRRELSSAAQLVGGVLLLASLVLGLIDGSASASTGPADGSNVPGSALPAGTFTAGTPFASGQLIDITIPANSNLQPASAVHILECSDPGGLVANDPTSISDCDGNTIDLNGVTNYVNSDGSVDIDDYPIYALPDGPTLGETTSNGALCNLADACVLYVGENQENFSGAPYYLSQPFWVSANSTDDGEPAGDGSAPSTPTEPSASTSTVAASATSSVADGHDPVEITVTLLGSGSVPVPGKTVTLSPTTGSSSVVAPSQTGSDVSNSNGVATFVVTDASVESVTYTATDTTDSPNVVVTETVSVSFVAPVVSGANSSVVASPANVPDDGTTASTITVTLRDQGSSPQPVAGKAVTLAASGGSSQISGPSPATTNSQGQVTFEVTDTTDEIVTYTATDTTDSPKVVLTATASVTFGTLTVSAGDSKVVAASNPAPVGGIGTTVTVTLLTSGGSPVPGKDVTLTDSPSSSTATIALESASATTGTDGTVTFKVSDTAQETLTLSATDTTDSLPLTETAQVAFQTPSVSGSKSTVTSASTSEPADGVTPALVTVTLEDQLGDPVAGKNVTGQLADNSGNATATPEVSPGGTVAGVTDSTGAALFDVRDTTAEQVTFTATDSSDSVVITQTVSITFLPGLPDATTSSIGANPSQVASDGKTPSTVTVTLEDRNQNPVPEKAVTLSASGGSSTISPSTAVTTNSQGQAAFEVTDSKTEVVTYTATDQTDDIPLTGQSVSVTFGTPPPPLPTLADSVITSSGTTAPADGKTAVTIAVFLNDANGDPVQGKIVSLNPSGGSSSIDTVVGTTDGDGQATFTVTDKTAETVTYAATDSTDDMPLEGQSVQVVFTTAAASSTTSSSTAANATSSSAGTGTTSSSAAANTTSSSAATGTGSSSSASGSASGGSSGGSATTGIASEASSTASPSSLAFTGAPSAFPWLVGIGLLLLVGGSLGRRLALRE